VLNMGKQAHPETSKEHMHAINISKRQMAVNKECQKYCAKVPRRSDDRYIWPKGMRKEEVFRPVDEEITNEAHHSLCSVFLFQIFAILNYEKSNHFELRQFCINTYIEYLLVVASCRM
jgi:hypothetical protein